VNRRVCQILRFSLQPSPFCFLMLLAYSSAQAAVEPKQVLVLVNKDTPVSSQIARMYQKLREIPAENVLSLSLGADRQITPEQHWSRAKSE